jgi:type IV fimbrial biogenesis protein FimT
LAWREYTRRIGASNAKRCKRSGFAGLAATRGGNRMGPMSPLFPHSSSRGVTLTELCFALAIVAVLAGLAAPGFRGAMRSAAVRAGTYELLAGVQQTRGRSIVQSIPGILCPSDAAGNCLPAAQPASYWRASLEPAAGPAGVELHGLPVGVVLRASRAPLRFWPDSLAASTGTLTICDEQRVAPPRAIVVSVSGRARLEPAPATACG